jgi:hypothetical protein
MIRRIHIHVEVAGDKPDIWFQYGKPIEGYSTPASSSRSFRTISKARKMARGIIDKYPEAVVNIDRHPKFNQWLKMKRVKGEIWRKRR